jgi:hypothetical protein
MELTNSILKDTRDALGIGADVADFDADILQHINFAIGAINQNGVGRFIVVTDDTTTWDDLRDPLQTKGNSYFQMVPLYITTKTKLLFDPPPPSTVQYYDTNANEILWRLKIAYE